MKTEIAVADVLQVADGDFYAFPGADIGQACFELIAALLFNNSGSLAGIPGLLVSLAGALFLLYFPPPAGVRPP